MMIGLIGAFYVLVGTGVAIQLNSHGKREWHAIVCGIFWPIGFAIIFGMWVTAVGGDLIDEANR